MISFQFNSPLTTQQQNHNILYNNSHFHRSTRISFMSICQFKMWPPFCTHIVHIIIISNTANPNKVRILQYTQTDTHKHAHYEYITQKKQKLNYIKFLCTSYNFNVNL